ncbi:DUF4136 domain-containing protein [Arenibacter sp. ARW7G5Y1]|uniref:DUF4136 domain-containing protein n=1 Tax=Arenibacter sp. ARW7G5Y1 TaxID=2135619 RepID=UPI000D767211|nr:DUF4136 domain-containing protein [Arenibacter sp. ARW7G5Y1]PXX23951.1 uncharacterized protein DUF4136 [Arenibacter sp. ARW7G5Y1]|tara:strand:- start:18228 stop:18755 length:528 start_codon:yes stop_codon:yes gene_type:complete
MKSIIPFLLLLFLASCGAIRVNYDYDRDTDYSKYTTYNYYSDMDTGLSELDTRRLVRAIDSTLRAKGLLLSEEPEFLINILSSSFQAPRNNTVGVGIGGSGRNVGGGMTIGIPVGAANVEREIQFDFVDSEKDELFWQAVTVSSLRENSSPSVREAKIQELVTKTFEKYPPKSRK